jgi:putative Mg2+ transporter-C (MgtC) family protein
MLDAFQWNWQLVVVDLVRLALAFALAFPIGWERSHSARSIGLRTFPLVAVASCGYMLIAKSAPGATAESMARALQGLLAGIGFIGGGAILKDRGTVYGLATATSIWSTGAVGAAVAYEREELALILSLMNFALLRFLTPLASTDQRDERDDSSNEDT